MHLMILEDQKGFMENKYTCIGEDIRIIYDTLYETEEYNIPGMLLLLDFE